MRIEFNKGKLGSASSRGGKRRPMFGVTAVELMIAVAMAAIVLTTAVPTFSSTVHKNRIESAATQLLTSLNLARAEAVKRRRSARVCPSADAGTCRGDGPGSAT